ncbi:MAG: hypothetical protein KDK62_02285 [Chlamydiia bacterium]|nr:hypothetical protein [Chlamydiia bacterium]
MADITAKLKYVFTQTCFVMGSAQGHFHTAADIAKGPLKLAKAVKEVSGRAIKGFSAISPSLEGLLLVDDLTGPIGIVADLIKWQNGEIKTVWAKARAIALIGIRSLAFTGALSRLGAIDLSKLSAVVGKVPYAGETMSRFNISAVIQPFLIAMYVLDIADQGMKVSKNSDELKRAEKKRADWSTADFDPTVKGEVEITKPDKTKETIRISHFEKRSIKKVVKDKDGNEIVNPKTGRTFQEHIDWKTRKYNELSDAEKVAYKQRKFEKWGAKAHNARLESRKAWMSVAVDVIKITAAVLTFALLTTAVVTAVPAFATITVTVVAVAAMAKLGKVLYDFHHAQLARENLPKMAPVRIA